MIRPAYPKELELIIVKHAVIDPFAGSALFVDVLVFL